MSEAISFAELSGHELELLPARVVLTSMCFGAGSGSGDGGGDSGGDGGGDANLNANENTNTNTATASASIVDASGLLGALLG